MASHDDAHFDAFSKLCDATEYHLDKHFKSWRFGSDDEPINIEFYSPVLVVQGRLLDARPTRKGVLLRETNHIQFRRMTIVKNEETNHQIDVVTEQYFPKYIIQVHHELTKIVNSMKRKKNIIRKSLIKIVNDAKRLKSPDKIRKAMEF